MGLFTVVRDPGVRENWQKPASLVVPTPALHPISVRRQSRQRLSEFFLAAQRRTASAVKKKLSRGNPFKGFLWTPSQTEGRRPLWHPELPGTDSVTNRACSRTFEYSLVEGYDKLGRPNSAQSKFSLKISLRGAAFSAMRSPVPHCSPPRKDFCRAKMPCGGQVFQICCSAGRSSDILQTSKAVHTRKRVLPKYVEDARLGGHCKSGTPGISKGPQPFCFRKSPEKTLLKGFLWATSSRRLDTALLCAAKKRGVEIKQAGRLLPV